MIKNALRQITPPVIWKIAEHFTSNHRSPVHGEQKDSKWYNVYYAQFRDVKQHYASSPYYFMYAVLADRILRANHTTLLEIGCGRGRLPNILRHQNFKNYVGFDFSREQLKIAQRNCPEFSFLYADAFTTDLYDTVPYDAVVCTEFLEHVEGDLEIINKVRKGVRFYGSVPSFPFESHVRHFSSTNEVEQRYSSLFLNFCVIPYFFKSEKQIIYIFEGITI